MRYCIRCSKVSKGRHSLCAYCRAQIVKYFRVEATPKWISDKMGVSVYIIKEEKKRYQPKGSLLPPGHTYFDYRGQLEAMLKKLTEKTGIRNFNTQKGQIVLAEINRSLEASRIQSKDDWGYEIYGDRYGYDREIME